MTLIPIRTPTSLLQSLLDDPLQFDDPITRSDIKTRGTREVLAKAAHVAKPIAKSVESNLTWPSHLAHIKRPGAGLHNPSMACYANATLQILLHTPPVLDYVLKHDEHACAQSKRGYCMTCALHSIAGKHWSHKHYSPNEVHGNLPRIRKGFSKHRQEDTHEFFRFVTDGLQASALAHLKNPPERAKQSTWVHKTWGGQVRSRVVCSKCQKPSDTFDSFLDLSLDVNKGSRPKLLGMLQGFIREDKLEGENKYHCENCKSKANATKSFRIARAPPILTFHLKRFNVNYESGRARAQKYNQMIDYPEYIDISPFMINQSGKVQYRLIGVTCHRGTELRFGHYTSYVRGPDGRWSHADDEDVTLVPADRALSDKTAYVLSYIRDDSFANQQNEPLPSIQVPSTATDSLPSRHGLSTPSPRPLMPSNSPIPLASKRKRDDTPDDTPIIPNGSPIERKFGYQPSPYKPNIIKSESFYGKPKGKKHRGAPMPFAHGKRKGMIGKMRRK